MLSRNSLEEDGGIHSKESLLNKFIWDSAHSKIQTPSVNRKSEVSKGQLKQKIEFSQLNDCHYAASGDVCESLCSDVNANAGNIRLNTGSLPVYGFSVNSYSLPTCTDSLPINTDRQSVNKSKHYRNSKFQICKTKNGLSTRDNLPPKETDGNKSTSVNLQSRIQSKQNIGNNEKTDSETSVESSIRQDNNYKQQAQGKPSTGDNVQENLPEPMVDEATVSKFEPLMTIIDKLADGQKVPPQISMQYEMLRFCTLRSFPKENKPFITRLAQAGFYYASSGDELVCYCCAGRKSNWVETDIPLDVHRQMNPNCKFLVRNNEVNVSIKTSQFLTERTMKSKARTPATNKANKTNDNCKDSVKVTTTLAPSTKQPLEEVNCEGQATSNVCSSHDKGHQEKQSGKTAQSPQPEFTRSQGSDANGVHVAGISSSALLALNEEQNSDLQRRTDKCYPMPKYPKYANESVRLASFSDCKNIAVSAERLAESGLFYVGYGDCVRCFLCGVGLRDWTVDDDPWIEHSRWSKNCSFIIRTKGRDFVETVQLAVQYSQHHGENASQAPNDGSAAAANSNVDTDVLLHTDAAQSVLEMGYHPDIIRAALRKVLQSHDRNDVTAAKLMEVIFEIEDNFDIDEKTLPSNSRSEKMHDQASNGNSSNQNVGPNHTTFDVDVKESSSHKDMSLSLEIRKMKKENEILKQQTICSKCKKNEVCIVFLPCGHLITCEGCAPSVKYCSFVGCGKYIKGTVRTYMS